MDCYSWNCQ